MNYLVTGAAGFIGFYTVQELLEQGHTVIGLDSVNDYYRVDLKEERLRLITEKAKNLADNSWFFYRGMLEDESFIHSIFERHHIDRVIHLAAQAGVRHSITNPRAYTSSNIEGFLTILEACRAYSVSHLAFASSSSVYGLNTRTPSSESDPVDHPVSLYAATKRANELMAHSYSHLYGLPVTGMRFFTVYGPYGRPDMAYYKFADAIACGKPIDVYNNGDLMRDFTYIDDVVKAVCLIIQRPPVAGSAQERPDISSSPFRIYNIGNEQPVQLDAFISTLEQCMGIKAIRNNKPMQMGDVYMTAANTESLEKEFGWKPSTSLLDGLQKFTSWYKEKQLWQK